MLKSINSRIFIPMGIIIILIFAFFSYVLIRHQNKFLLGNVYKDANLYSQLILESTRFNMPINNRECIHRMMKLIGNRNQIKMIRMFDNIGRINFSTKESEVDTLVDLKTESCNKCHASTPPLEDLSYEMRSRIFKAGDEEILAFTTPIPNEPGCYTHSCHIHSKEKKILGIIDIGISLAAAHREINQTQWMLILFTLVTIICLSMILFFFIHKFVSNPVKKLVKATVKVSEGNLDVTIPVRTKCEIGQLAESFNLMISDMKKAQFKINAWNQELERKVKERTYKLDQAKYKLIQAEKMASMGILAASVAHEINNPLQGILTYIKLMLKIMKKNQVSPEQIDSFTQYLELMQNEIERCGGMVKNLLVFSKQTKLNVDKADINRIIKNSLQIIENKIKLQNIEVDLQLDEEVSIIQSDLKQIQQTMIAFLINSIEAIQENGKITIRTRNFDKEYVEIKIADNGTGIEENKLKNIFDPFFTTKKDSRSTGLGLFVAYGIIKEHGGNIEVHSKVGQGTEFLIKLPLKSIGEKKDES
jgi:two-component system NtrC family sensor kinase